MVVVGSQQRSARLASDIDRAIVPTLEQYEPLVPDPPKPSKEDLRRAKAAKDRHIALRAKSRREQRPCGNGKRTNSSMGRRR
jgi:hypothetical protein